MKIFSIIALGVLGIVIIIVGSDFYLLWLPLAHSTEYPTKAAALFMAVTAWVTLFLVLTAIRTLNASNVREIRERQDNLRKEVLKWAIEINNFALANRTEAISGFTATKFGEFINNHIYNWLFEEIEPARSRSVYAEEVALKLTPDIREAATSLKESLRTQIDLLHKLRKREDDRSTLRTGLKAMSKQIAPKGL